jgi:hypothetical protein
MFIIWTVRGVSISDKSCSWEVSESRLNAMPHTHTHEGCLEAA